MKSKILFLLLTVIILSGCGVNEVNEKENVMIKVESSEENISEVSEIVITTENWAEYFEFISEPICDTSSSTQQLTIQHYIALKEEYRDIIEPSEKNCVLFEYNYEIVAYEYELINAETCEYKIVGESDKGKALGNQGVGVISEYRYFVEEEYKMPVGDRTWFIGVGENLPAFSDWKNIEVIGVKGTLYTTK